MVVRTGNIGLAVWYRHR